MNERWKKAGWLLLCAALWAMTLGWLYQIFYFSGQNGEESVSLSMKVAVFLSEKLLNGRVSAEALHMPLRKLAHFGIFAVEGALLTLALGASMRRRAVPLCISVPTCVAMAALNELHETMIRDRDGNLLDVCIDSAGAVVGIIFAWLVLSLVFAKLRGMRKA